MSFKVGQKVVCLRTTKKPVKGYTLKKDEIYTCQGYSKHPASKREILIKEQPSITSNEYGDMYCCAPENWFRPLDYDFVEEVISKIKENELVEP